MSQRVLPKEAVTIMSFIDELGGISDKQLDLLLGSQCKHKDYYISTLKNKYINVSQKGIYTAKIPKNTYTSKREKCAWALLHNMQNEDGSPVTFYAGNKLFELTFLKDGTVYDVLYVDLNSSGTLSLVEQNFIQLHEAKKGQDIPVCYLLVIDDMRVQKMIEEKELLFPNKVAFLQYQDDDSVEIEYYC